MSSQNNQLLYSLSHGTCVIKLIGDVRVVQCASLSAFFDNVLFNNNITEVVIDLEEAKLLDSTSLGLLAEFALAYMDRQEGVKPMIMTSSEDMLQLLDAMGFEDIFDIKQSADQICQLVELESMPEIKQDEAMLRQKVIQVHELLMSLNDNNRQLFSDMVDALKQEQSLETLNAHAEVGYPHLVAQK